MDYNPTAEYLPGQRFLVGENVLFKGRSFKIERVIDVKSDPIKRSLFELAKRNNDRFLYRFHSPVWDRGYASQSQLKPAPSELMDLGHKPADQSFNVLLSPLLNNSNDK